MHELSVLSDFLDPVLHLYLPALPPALHLP